MNKIDAYNSDKVRLQETITKVYDTIKRPEEDTFQYASIKEESHKLYHRQEVIFTIMSAVTVAVVLGTISTISK
jgi:hypothetical protein